MIKVVYVIKTMQFPVWGVFDSLEHAVQAIRYFGFEPVLSEERIGYYDVYHSIEDREKNIEAPFMIQAHEVQDGTA